MARAEIAVVAHAGKKLGGGLSELRRALAKAGHARPIWREVPKSRKAPKAVRRAVKKGAKLIFVWGGDGMVQRCIDALAGHKKVELAIVPAGTANLLAAHLRIPKDIGRAVRIGLRGPRAPLDVGVVNGERFAVMAGVGFDAIVMQQVNGARKKRLGRLAYFHAAAKAMKAKPVRTTIRVDGTVWFEGPASAVLVGNIGAVTGGLTVFPAASARDGLLDIGVVTAESRWQWLRVLARLAGGNPDRSPLVQMTRGKRVAVALARKRPYQLDGGVRPPTRRLEVRVKAGAVTCAAARRVSPDIVKPRTRRGPPRRRSD